jgi:hypothetical protein
MAATRPAGRGNLLALDTDPEGGPQGFLLAAGAARVLSACKKLVALNPSRQMA